VDCHGSLQTVSHWFARLLEDCWSDCLIVWFSDQGLAGRWLFRWLGQPGFRWLGQPGWLFVVIGGLCRHNGCLCLGLRLGLRVRHLFLAEQACWSASTWRHVFFLFLSFFNKKNKKCFYFIFCHTGLH